MPSPFPGMDPFIEGQAREDFHHRLIAVLSEALTARVRPRYVVRVEQRVYLEHPTDPEPERFRPDVAVLRSPPVAGGRRPAPAAAADGVADGRRGEDARCAAESDCRRNSCLD